MAKKSRSTRTELSSAFEMLATRNRDGSYSVRLPSEGDRVVTVQSEANAKVIAEAETLRQKLSAR